MESDDITNDFRFYWNNPRLVAQLPEEQRKKISEKFFELLKKSKEMHTNTCHK